MTEKQRVLKVKKVESLGQAIAAAKSRLQYLIDKKKEVEKELKKK